MTSPFQLGPLATRESVAGHSASRSEIHAEIRERLLMMLMIAVIGLLAYSIIMMSMESM